ncbi:MAG: hypothetical protein J6T23_05820 [Elusimicrobia bacterium]|nr:hypothetical protein [Elusimicrobiota bacterium]
MFLYKKALVVVILLVSVVGLYAFEQTLSPQQDITVGDKVVLNIKAEGLTVDSLDKEKLTEANFGDFELLDVQSAQDGSVNFVLSVYKVGKVELLSVEIPYEYIDQKKFVKTNALPIEVKSVLDPKNPPTDILGIKGIVKFHHGLLWYLLFLIVLVVLSLIIYFIYKYIKKKNRKPTQEEIIQSIPPKEYALKQLDDLIALNLIENGHIKEYYDKLSDIIRFYVSRTYSVDGMEKTTTELYSMLKNKIAPEHNRELKNYLINCDFVKFAKLIPSREDIKNDFDIAKSFIEKL